MPYDSAQENRQSFRIVDHAWVEIIPVSDTTAAPLDSYFPRSSQFDLLTDLQQLDHELQHQLFKLTETNSILATALQLLNQKIGRLASQITTDPALPTPQPLTLSEGGVSLSTEQPFIDGSHCALRIRLQPSGYALQSFAQVRYQLEQDANHFRMGLEFINLDETARDLIARHILEYQAYKLRNQRQRHTDA
jgi:hypothetical protein